MILIRGGTVIDPETAPHVRPATDVLINGSEVIAVGSDLAVGDAEVIEAGGRLVLPGLVDTHRHTWQTVLRSVAPDVTFQGYMDLVMKRFAPRFRPEDVYAGNLLGALECLDSGITTLLDWSHIQLSPDHTDAAMQALRDSGIRAFFGLAHPTLTTELHEEIRRAHGAASGLLGLVFAAHGPVFGGGEAVVAEWRLARELGCRISVHVHGEGRIEKLAEHELLGSDTTYIHLNRLTDNEMKLISDSGGFASVTPFIEAQMGFGTPEVARLRRFGITTGLGADTVTNVPGNLFDHMRGALSFGRAEAETEGIEPMTALDALRMATIDGAGTLGLADRIGSLTPGKQADVILLRTDTPNMTPMRDPIGAVVTAATAHNVDTVLVAGNVVKRDGRLVHTVLRRALDLAERSADHLAL